MSDTPLDCLVIGGGPAGLTAAIYLARFHLSVLVVDRGGGRARSIPRTHNHAGYPGGIVGNDLVDRMAEQAKSFGVDLRMGEVSDVAMVGEDFRATVSGITMAARTVLLATGITNDRPDMPPAIHDEAVAMNLLRYCPVCDGYEVTDLRVGAIGTGNHAANEALFLRSYTPDVTLIAPDGPHAMDDADQRRLAEAGVVLVDGPVDYYAIAGEQMTVDVAGGSMAFDAIYPALGSTIHSALAKGVGAAVTTTGCIKVDAHQRTSVAGLYAAGDVVIGLDQISHAMGQAGVAATAIRNDLAARAPLRR